jgi:hypothetical protein
LRGIFVQRREAVLLLREIDDCPESKLISCIFLKPQNHASDFFPQSYELYIANSFTKAAIKFIKSIVEKHDLKMKESEGYLVIYAPDRKILEIVA